MGFVQTSQPGGMSVRVAALIAAFSCSACATLPESMKKAGPTLPAGNPALAQLVFARPLSFIGSAEFVYVIEKRTQRVLGVTTNESAFSIELEPGIYELCPAPNIELPAWQQMVPYEVSRFLRTPITRIEVAAGRRYLLEVNVDRGLYEFVPARPGSQRERRLKEGFQYLQLLEPNESSVDLHVSPEELAPWIENCVDSSGFERRTLNPEEGEAPSP